MEERGDCPADSELSIVDFDEIYRVGSGILPLLLLSDLTAEAQSGFSCTTRGLLTMPNPDCPVIGMWLLTVRDGSGDGSVGSFSASRVRVVPPARYFRLQDGATSRGILWALTPGETVHEEIAHRCITSER